MTENSENFRVKVVMKSEDQENFKVMHGEERISE